jgi:hypothetical protein
MARIQCTEGAVICILMAMRHVMQRGLMKLKLQSAVELALARTG